MSELKNALESDNVGLAAYLYTVPPDQFRKDISQLQASVWTKVEDGLPEEKGWYVVSTLINGKRDEGLDLFYGGKFCLNYGSKYVTHFMPKKITPPTE